jgi:hypothetical protein
VYYVSGNGHNSHLWIDLMVGNTCMINGKKRDKKFIVLTFISVWMQHSH